MTALVQAPARESEASLSSLRGPLRIVAGAGTGKTALIAERFKALVQAGVDPESILVMTFTERAAAEMRARILKLLPGWLPRRLNIGTFHAVAQAWLRDDGWRVGLPVGFRILAGADRWILLRELLWETAEPALVGVERPDDLVTPLLRMHERLKQELVPARRFRAWAEAQPDQEASQELVAASHLFTAYDRRCREQRVLDFDQLLVSTVNLLAHHDDVRETYSARFPWLMVDEYQDTNLAQERMVELLAQGFQNVCVVGDDDQSIYRFRGASTAGMERFLRCFPSARTEMLARNRRSTANIVETARALIEQNRDRLPKALTAVKASGPKVRITTFATGSRESRAIAVEARRLARGGMPLREMAVLTRTNALSRPVQEALAAAGIPYRVWSASGFYERPEIRDVIAYLRFVKDPLDEVALARLLQRPELELNLEEGLRLLEAGRREALPPLQALEAAPTARPWAATIRELIGQSSTQGVNELFFDLMERTRLLEPSSWLSRDEQARVLANVNRFSELLEEHCAGTLDHSLSRFMDHLELVILSGVDEVQARVEGNDDAVHVMTIHQAKGLEFDAVFLPAVVEGRLPQPSRSERLEIPAGLAEATASGREDHLAEERRLCYVAMTRARRRLYLSAARRYDGQRRWQPSRFLAEIVAGAASAVASRDVRAAAEPIPRSRGAARSSAPKRPLEESVEISFSSASIYRECPRRYWFRYVHRVPVKPASEAQYGTLVHDVLRMAGQRRSVGEVVDEPALQRLLDEAWAELVLADPRRGPALQALSWGQLRGYLADGGLETAPAMVEQPFTIELDGWRLRGVIDRVDPPSAAAGPDGSSAWKLVDYKTGSPAPASQLRRDLQLALYGLGARRAFGLDPLELEIVYLKTGKRVRLAADSSLLGEAERIGGEVADGIREQRFEPRPERRRCQLCPYRLPCDAAL